MRTTTKNPSAMKKASICIVAILLAAGSIHAQDKSNPRLSKEEFREKQQTFITQRAELTPEEARKFFPLFYELQDKKKLLNDSVRWNIRQIKRMKAVPAAQYEKALDQMYDTRIRAAQMDKEYYLKFKSVLPAQKIYKVQRAEMCFKRDIVKEKMEKEKKV